MNEIKLYKSSKRAIKLMLLCTPFVVIGIWMISSGNNSWAGYASVLFFGLGYPIGIFNLLDKRPQIIFNEIGVFDRTIHNEFINWELIQDAYPYSINNQKFVSLQIDESFKPSKRKNSFYKSVVKFNEALGAQELNLNLGHIKKIDEVRLTQFILAMTQAKPSERTTIIKQLNPKSKSN